MYTRPHNMTTIHHRRRRNDIIWCMTLIFYILPRRLSNIFPLIRTRSRILIIIHCIKSFINYTHNANLWSVPLHNVYIKRACALTDDCIAVVCVSGVIVVVISIKTTCENSCYIIYKYIYYCIIVHLCGM